MGKWKSEGGYTWYLSQFVRGHRVHCPTTMKQSRLRRSGSEDYARGNYIEIIYLSAGPTVSVLCIAVVVFLIA